MALRKEKPINQKKTKQIGDTGKRGKNKMKFYMSIKKTDLFKTSKKIEESVIKRRDRAERERDDES